MNLLQRATIAYKALQMGYDLPLLMKAASQGGVNLFNEDYYRYLGNDQPVYMEHNASNYLTKGFMFNSDVYSIINYRANLVNSVPFKLYKKVGPNEYEIIENDTTGLLDLVATLDRKALSIYEDTVGNAYIYAPFLDVGGNRGKTTELNILKADIVQIVTGGALEPIKGYKYSGSTSPAIPASEVLHFKNFNPSNDPHDSLYGMSPLRAAVQQISVSNDGTYSMNAAFKNQGVKSIVFAKDNKDAEWTQEQAVNLKDTWQRQNGPGKQGSVVFNSKELGKIDLGMSMVELNTLSGLMHNFRQLCNVFDGFPSVLLNDNESSTYNNLDTAHKAVYTNCVLPRLYRYRDGLNKWLTPRYGKDLYLDIDTSGIEVLQENKKETAEYLERAWWVKVVDKQKMLGTPEDPGMDFYMVPNNLVPVRNLEDLQPDTSIDEALKKLKHKEYLE